MRIAADAAQLPHDGDEHELVGKRVNDQINLLTDDQKDVHSVRAAVISCVDLMFQNSIDKYFCHMEQE